MVDTIKVYTGETVTVEHVKSLPTGGARFDIAAENGRKWRVDIEKDGSIDVVTTWRDGTLADLDVPAWMDDVAVRLARS
jgi:hypothetical protein